MNDIEFKNVFKSYDGKNMVIEDLNLTIPFGERIILLGPSGCGKSTILRMIAGLESVTAGDIYLGGERVNDKEPGQRNVSMVFQNYALYPHMTVASNILFGMRVAKTPKEIQEERLAWALDILGMSEYRERLPKQLSGGQRQRVALCRALVKKAPYFLLDEPLSNLDAQLRTAARAELVKIHEVYSPTFVYVTHDQIEAMTVGQRIIVLNKSVIQQYDTPDKIYNQPANVFVARFIGSPSMNIVPVDVQGAALVIGQERISVPERWRERIGAREKIKFGLRPEHFALGSGGDASVTVTYVENHGNRLCMALKLGGEDIMATADASFALGEHMRLKVDWDKAHFFDAETDLNIGYPDRA